MAKVAFSKLGVKTNQEVKTITWNDQTIEVKQYLPVNNKLELISRVINLSADENNFANPVKVDIYFAIEMVDAYTNISFTEKQKEDVCKLFDSITSSGLLAVIRDAIPEEEYGYLYHDINACVSAVYSYKNSVMGILENITTDYDNLNLDASAIQQKLADPQNLELLKGVMAKLG